MFVPPATLASELKFAGAAMLVEGARNRNCHGVQWLLCATSLAQAQAESRKKSMRQTLISNKNILAPK